MRFKFADVNKLYEKYPQLKREDVENLSEWVKNQPHLPSLTELQVMVALSGRDFRIEEAKKAIDIFFTLKTHSPEIFNCIDDEDLLRSTLSVGFINILPQKTPEGYVVALMKLLDPNPDNFNTIHLLQALNMISALYYHQIGFENGTVVVIDMIGYSLWHIPKINWLAVKKALYYLQEATPVRFKGIHFINVVPFFDKLVALAKPFLKQDLYRMLNFHVNGIDTLFEYVPKEIFPEEYGGKAPPIAVLNETCIKNLVDSSEFFRWHDTQTVDESKRPPKTNSLRAMFGLKNLQID